MANRPSHLDLSAAMPNAGGASRQQFLAVGDMPSPRVGEVPPALSPLDALALQGRILAQRFDEEKQKGRRMSRLPPLTVANEFAKARPTFFRSGSEDSGTEELPSPRTLMSIRTRTQPKEQRPKSHYPQIQYETDETDAYDDYIRSSGKLSVVGEAEAEDYFGIPRAQSPEQMDPTPVPEPAPRAVRSTPKPVPKPIRTDSTTSRGGLAPPMSPVHSLRHQSSFLSSSAIDDSDHASIGGSMDSLPHKKPSTATMYSRSPSPFSPFRSGMTIPRSPSTASDQSFGPNGLPRPTFNFSRPLSRSSTSMSYEIPRSIGQPSPSRQASGESSSTRPSFDFPFTQPSLESPITPHSIEFPPAQIAIANDDSEPTADQPVSSYIYSKYTLPRGKSVQRESIGPAAFMNQQFAAFEADKGSITSSPPRFLERPRTRADSPTRHSKISTSSSAATVRPATSGVHRSASAEHHKHSPKLGSDSSPRTSMPNLPRPDAAAIKAGLEQTKPEAGCSDFNPEDHLQKGIDCHEAGKLAESTYHLRIAAKAGLPTGMLLYALACRHGWGMRPSPTEGVRWLQRAVDSSQLMVQSDSNPTNPTIQDALMQQSHRAQFALSVYELGVSYMNGWGVQKDASLALRCFEVAGSWGDADALSEAGYCYTEGVGCKKDRAMAAWYYRRAGEKGVSMAGQSWIYKDKYMQDPDVMPTRGRGQSTSSDKKKPRDKSRTRTIFGRKKSFAS